MYEKIVKFLQQKGAPASSTELVEKVLMIRDIQPSVAEKLVDSIVRDGEKVYYNKDGLWDVHSTAETDHSNIVSFILISTLPERVNFWTEWQSIGLMRIQNGQEIDRLVLERKIEPTLNGHADFIPPLEKAGQFIRNDMLIFDGFGNQMSMFSRAMFDIIGFNIENPKFSLRLLAKRLFPDEKIGTSARLSGLLQLRALENATLALRLDSLLEQFQALMHLLQERGISQLADFYEGEKQHPDYSKYHFDQEFIENLPFSPGCYIMRNEKDDVIYVGKAKNLNQRVRSYFSETAELDDKLTQIRRQIHTLEIQQTGSELEALLLEQKLIRQFQPPINSLFEIHHRQYRQKSRYSQILLLPSVQGEFVKLYFLNPYLGLREHNLAKNFANAEEIKNAIAKFFFQPSGFDPAGNVQEDMELAMSWLSLNEDYVTNIDMRRVSTADETMRILKDHLVNFSSETPKTIHY